MRAKDKYDLYLKKYCNTRKVSGEEAAKHKLVQEAKKYYEEEQEKDE